MKHTSILLNCVDARLQHAKELLRSHLTKRLSNAALRKIPIPKGRLGLRVPCYPSPLIWTLFFLLEYFPSKQEIGLCLRSFNWPGRRARSLSLKMPTAQLRLCCVVLPSHERLCSSRTSCTRGRFNRAATSRGLPLWLIGHFIQLKVALPNALIP